MATHSSIFAWRIPWTEEPDGLTVHGVAKSQTRLSRHALTHITWYGRTESLLLTRTRAPAAYKWKPTPYFVFWTSGKLRALLYYSTVPVLVHFPRADEIFETWKRKVLAPKYENKVAKLIRTNKHLCAMCVVYVLSCSVAQSCSTLCDSTDSNPPVSSVHGIFQARIHPGIEPTSLAPPALAGRFFTTAPPGKPLINV